MCIVDGRLLVLLYGVVSYVVFFATLLWSIGFVGNLVVPNSIDSAGGDATTSAFLINAVLLGIFAISHSVMARPGFKSVWTKIIPTSIERSTYVLVSSAALILLFWQWHPMSDIVWSVTGTGATIIMFLFWAGWGIVLLSSTMISHFDLFGLRQVYLRFQSREYSDIPFQTPFAYRFVRHPLLLGFVIAFWAAPTMTAGHLLFAIATTAYTLIGIQLEERDMEIVFGTTYRAYKKRVPMLIPTGRSMRRMEESVPEPETPSIAPVFEAETTREQDVMV